MVLARCRYTLYIIYIYISYNSTRGYIYLFNHEQIQRRVTEMVNDFLGKLA